MPTLYALPSDVSHAAKFKVRGTERSHFADALNSLLCHVGDSFFKGRPHAKKGQWLSWWAAEAHPVEEIAAERYENGGELEGGSLLWLCEVKRVEPRQKMKVGWE